MNLLHIQPDGTVPTIYTEGSNRGSLRSWHPSGPQR